jgi:predicted nucleic acid-binding protein
MAKVFVDTNCFIGLVNRIPEIASEDLQVHEAYISILSCHILFYVNKITTPDAAINSFIEDFLLVPLDTKILQPALLGPTEDLEDNIQLHSAVKANVDFFVTLDKKLLSMKFFGKTHIVPPEELQKVKNNE